MILPLRSLEVVLDHAFAGQLRRTFFSELAPNVHARVVHRARVVHVRRELPIHMVVSERDVIPPGRANLLGCDLNDRAFLRDGVRRKNSWQLAVDDEDVVFRRRIRIENRMVSERIRHGQYREIAIGEREPLRLLKYDVNPELLEQSQDAARLDCLRRIVIPGNHHHDRVRQRLREAAELGERVNDRGVRGTHGMKHVAGDEHDVRRNLDDLVDRALERLRDIPLALVDASWGLPLVLAVAEVKIGDVDQPHAPNIDRNTRYDTSTGRVFTGAWLNVTSFDHGTARTHCVTFMVNRMASAVLPVFGVTTDRTI